MIISINGVKHILESWIIGIEGPRKPKRADQEVPPLMIYHTQAGKGLRGGASGFPHLSLDEECSRASLPILGGPLSCRVGTAWGVVKIANLIYQHDERALKGPKAGTSHKALSPLPSTRTFLIRRLPDFHDEYE